VVFVIDIDSSDPVGLLLPYHRSNWCPNWSPPRCFTQRGTQPANYMIWLRAIF